MNTIRPLTMEALARPCRSMGLFLPEAHFRRSRWRGQAAGLAWANRFGRWAGWAVFLATNLLRANEPAEADLGKLELQEAERCRKNLENIGTAIQAYRLDRQDIPEHLSDLIPRFISDLSILKCPSCTRMESTSEEIMKCVVPTDPRITYTYEFRSDPIPKCISGGSIRTMREWKRLQMGLLGSDVPMVRCHCHSRSINLSFGGRIFEGTPDWEDAFRAVVRSDDLSFAKLFADYTVSRVIRIPERSPETPPRLIDLSDHYNASLRWGWHSENLSNNLASLPSGMVELAGVRFDVRGIVQLGATRQASFPHYPSAAPNIVVARKSPSFHFLHATAFPVKPGVKIGSYIFHYSDGRTAESPMVYGRHLLDWWSDPTKEGRFDQASDSKVAWSGTNAARAGGKKIYLYLSTWKNPYPTVTVDTMDFVSAMEPSAPFLIAVTAEPPAE